MDQEWAADQVEVTVEGFWTTHHRLQAAGEAGQDPAVLAELTLPAMQNGGTLRLADGREYTIRRVRWWKDEYELRAEPDVVAWAGPRAFFRREIDVHLGGQEYILAPAGFWTRAWQLQQAGIGALLEVRPAGVFRRGAILAILAELDLALVAWAYFLVQHRWQAEAAATAGAGAA